MVQERDCPGSLLGIGVGPGKSILLQESSVREFNPNLIQLMDVAADPYFDRRSYA